MNIMIQNSLDAAAAGASGLCLLHCLFLPLVIVILPAMSTMAGATETLHLISLIFVIPVSLTALGTGARRTGSLTWLFAGCAALILLILGAIFENSRVAGLALTILGSSLLIACHIQNWRGRAAASKRY